MKYLLAALLLGFLLYPSCKPAKDKVYCQGFVTREILHTPDHEEISRNFTLGCNGDCPNKEKCKTLEKVYDPPQPNGLKKVEWCGCQGDSVPVYCDVLLRTYISNGRIVMQADCTPSESCPVKSDSCIQVNKGKIDTIRTADNKDSLYKYTDQITCECVGKAGTSGN